MTIDLEKLSPAPWREGHPATLADLDFARLARNALDVMLRRGWVPHRWGNGWIACECTHNPGDGLLVLHEHDRRGRVLDAPTCADPFTALVEADCWYQHHVEKE